MCLRCVYYCPLQTCMHFSWIRFNPHKQTPTPQLLLYARFVLLAIHGQLAGIFWQTPNRQGNVPYCTDFYLGVKTSSEVNVLKGWASSNTKSFLIANTGKTMPRTLPLNVLPVLRLSLSQGCQSQSIYFTVHCHLAINIHFSYRIIYHKEKRFSLWTFSNNML